VKKLFWIFLLLLASNAAYAQDTGYFVRVSCDTLTPVANATVCLQTTTTGGRAAGSIYVWDGTQWVAPTGGSGTPGAPDTGVQFNNAGVLAGDAGMTYNAAANILTVTGDVVVAGQSVCLESGANCPLTVGEVDPVVAAINGIVKSNGKVISAATAGVDYEAADSDLAALANNATNGIWARTGAGTGAARTITGSGGISVADGDGVAGNPVISPGADMVKRNQANTYSGGGLQDMSANELRLFNQAGYAPTAEGRIGINTTTHTVVVGLNGAPVTLLSTAGSIATATALAADPAGCAQAGGQWTYDINASGVSNCAPIVLTGAANPTAGTVRFAGDRYKDTRTYDCTAGTGLDYVGQGTGTNFVPLQAQTSGWTITTADSGTPIVACGSATQKLEGSATVVTQTVPGSGVPDKVTFYSKMLTHATDCPNNVVGKDGQICVDQDDYRQWVCVPTAGDCDTAGEWHLTGGGGGGSPQGSADDIQFNAGGGVFGGGRCQMDSSANITCAGTGTFGSGVSSVITMKGVTSGQADIGVADAAGTPNRINLPQNTGNAGDVLTTDGGSPQQLSWVAQAAANKIRPCELTIGDNGSASPVLASDNGGLSDCKNVYGATLTITSVHCYTPTGATTARPQITGGAVNTILSAAITCGSTAGGVAGTLNGTPTQAANETIDSPIVADATSKYLKVYIVRTLP